MSISLPHLSALVSGWAVYLHKDIEEYYSGTTVVNSVSKQIIEGDIKNVRDALDLLEQELQKIDIFIPDNADISLQEDVWNKRNSL